MRLCGSCVDLLGGLRVGGRHFFESIMAKQNDSFRSESRLDALRMPPQSVPSEQSVIGACLLDPLSFHKIAGLLQESDFYRRDHRLIYRAIKELAEKGKPYDAVTLGEWFEANQLAEQIGGSGYLIELASTTPSAANIVAYAEIVKDKSISRQLIEAGTKIVNDNFQPEGRSSVELYAAAQRDLTAAGPRILSAAPTVRDVLRKVVVFMRDRMRDDAGDLLGYAMGLEDLDKQLNGLEKATLTIIAARPSQGKTLLALQAAIHGALHGKRVFVASIEMSAVALLMRAIACHGQVNLRSIRNPKEAEDHELKMVNVAAKALAETDLHIDDTAHNIDTICARIRQLHMEKPLDAAFIDYLQHMETPKAESQALGIQIITRKLKHLAKELDIPIVLLSQLNRSLEQRADKRPILADLRESGAIEQDADNVIFIYRDEYYNPNSYAKGMAELIVAKSRNEATGTVHVKTNMGKQRFYDCPQQDIPREPSREERREASRPTVGTRRFAGRSAGKAGNAASAES